MSRYPFIISLTLTLFASSLLKSSVFATIDVNLSELEYLAAHLDPRECRRLVAALHYDSYELPKSLAKAERKIDIKIPCIRQLLHWNSTPSEGKGKTHEHIQHRLRQINRHDLADWLGRTTFRELSKDLLKSIDEPISDVVKPGNPSEEAGTTSYFTTTETYENESSDDDDESFWYSIELIVIGLFALLLFTLCFVIGAFVIDRFAWCDDDGKDIDHDHKRAAKDKTTKNKRKSLANE